MTRFGVDDPTLRAQQAFLLGVSAYAVLPVFGFGHAAWLLAALSYLVLCPFAVYTLHNPSPQTGDGPISTVAVTGLYAAGSVGWLAFQFRDGPGGEIHMLPMFAVIAGAILLLVNSVIANKLSG